MSYLLVALLSTSSLSAFLRESVDRGDVAGVVALVISGDRVVYHEAFGKQDVGRGLPMQRDSIFRIASMTKPITSVAAMMLVDEGKLGVDDPVEKYLPDFHPQVITDVDRRTGTYRLRPATRTVAVRHIMTHTSGIGYGWSDSRLALVEEKARSESLLWLLHEPGERWTYGEGTTVLGQIVEKVSGKPLGEFVASHIFGPLGMRDTSWPVPDEKRSRVVTVQRRKDGKLVETPVPAELHGHARGDGGLYSTAADYGAFLRALLDGRLVSPASMRALTTNQLGNLRVQLQPTSDAENARPFPLGAGVDGWSLGFQIASRPSQARRRSAGSYSWAGFFNTYFWVDPQKKLAAVLLMQTLPFYDERALAVLQGFEERVYE